MIVLMDLIDWIHLRIDRSERVTSERLGRLLLLRVIGPM